jgi:single-strand DNA-binding protein
MNVVLLTGNLVRDPEKTYTSSGMAVTRFTVAINRFSRKAEGGQDADFIRITSFDKQAELVEKYLTKGSKVGVEGRIQTGSYQGKDGNTVYTTDVIANRVEFLDSRRSGDSAGGGFGGQFAGNQGGGQGAGPGAGSGQAGPGAGFGADQAAGTSTGAGFGAGPGPGESVSDIPDAFAELDDDDMPF